MSEDRPQARRGFQRLPDPRTLDKMNGPRAASQQTAEDTGEEEPDPDG